MVVRFVMDTDCLIGSPADSLILAHWWMHTSPHRIVYVADAEKRLLGLVWLSSNRPWDAPGTLADHMEPVSTMLTLRPQDDVEKARAFFAAHPEWPSLPVVDEHDILLGVITRDVPVLRPDPAPSYQQAKVRGVLQDHLLNALNVGLIVVDAHGMVRVVNPYGADLLGLDAEEVLGQPYEEVAQYLFPHMRNYLRESALSEVMIRDTARGEREFVIQNGRHVRFSFGTIRDAASLIAMAITFVDVTALREAEAKAEAIARQAEMAFGLALPSKVEAQLKDSPEFQDTYDPETGMATVTQVMPDGTYWHVVNGLWIMAELHAIGIFQLVGLDKDTMVQAFIFHDLSKEQPQLKPGDRFVPRETFDPGNLHAARSADWAVKEYHVSEDVEWLIRYHHTAEVDLPETFPAALKPMWRLFRIVDGLSSGMTRRQATLAPITRDGARLTIREGNADARYHRAYTVSIYTGEERALTDRPPH